MNALFFNIRDGENHPDLAFKYESACVAHNEQFLSADPRIRLQLRRLFRHELPPGVPLAGATAVLALRNEAGEVSLLFTVRADRTRVRNSRVGVMHAITRLSEVNPKMGAFFREIAEAQTVWGEP